MDSLALRYDLDFAYDAAVLRRDSLVSSALPKVFDKQWISTLLSGPQNLEVVFMGQQVIVGRSTPGSRPSALLEVSGRVLAADGSGGLPMVNIGVEGRALGTSTNDEGRFVLRYPRAYIGEALVFSSLGFVSERFSLPQNDSVLEVVLKNYSIHLPEVQVLYTDPDQLMRSVRRRLAQNYPSEPYLLTAFFRETIRQDDEYVEVSEAVVDIYKPSYQAGFASERVRFVNQNAPGAGSLSFGFSPLERAMGALQGKGGGQSACQRSRSPSAQSFCYCFGDVGERLCSGRRPTAHSLVGGLSVGLCALRAAGDF